MPLPPLKATKSAPCSMNHRRLLAGGSSAAASTITGILAACATRTTSDNAGRAFARAR